MTREEIITHMNVMAQTTLSGGMLYVMSEKDLEVVREAAALLKAQEPVKPKFSRVYDYDIRIFACGACGKEVGAEEMWNYCLHCGKAAKWDD